MPTDDQPLQYLNDDVLLREALIFTASATGFSTRLVEKDYYCSLLLYDFAPAFQHGMVFKGGTCLSKVYADFYRFSADLDFVIPIKTQASRSERRFPYASAAQAHRMATSASPSAASPGITAPRLKSRRPLRSIHKRCKRPRCGTCQV